ncbi:hypothetical protein EXN66_Car012231 [Channa argus]|uniref:Secreted protein n=1 Tax=Channa argus TaxID=215402 RepID=A0A6G1Q2F6_CHAAH|nr:hypothetical protein EXN66_Car012231 [Channa argus]
MQRPRGGGRTENIGVFWCVLVPFTEMLHVHLSAKVNAHACHFTFTRIPIGVRAASLGPTKSLACAVFLSERLML